MPPLECCPDTAPAHSLVRGVIDVDPSKVRSSVIKLLRTVRDDESSGAPSRSANPASMAGSSSMSLFEPANNQFALDSLPQNLGGGDLDGDYSLLEGMPLDDSLWSTWTDFGLFGMDTTGVGATWS